MHSSRRHRGVVVLLLASVIGVGSVLQLFRGGSITDHVGNVLYAAAVYLVICLAAPRTRPVVVAAVAMGICVAVEAFQLTSIPAQLSGVFPPSRLVFGLTFAWPDLLGYGVGAMVSGLVDRARLISSPSSPDRSARK